MFTEIFVDYLQKNKMTAYEVAKNTGISQGLMNEYKNGIKLPTIQNLIKIANYLDCSVDYLLGRTDNPAIFGQKGSNKMTFYQRIERICCDYNISIEKIDIGDDVEIYSCVYPHIEVFYRIYNQLKKILKDNKIYIHLFDEIYGKGSTDKMQGRMSDYIAANHINTASHLPVLDKCETFKEILPEEILKDLTLSSNENEQIINMERILYGTSSDSTQPKFSLADNPEAAEVYFNVASKKPKDPKRVTKT